MEPCGAAIAQRGWSPFASGQQPGFFVFMMGATTGIAEQIDGVTLPFWPPDARPCDLGHIAAMQAGDVEIPMIAAKIGSSDAGMAFQGGRGDHVDLAPPPGR